MSREFNLHLVSDSTGETISAIARACVSQFDTVRPMERFWNLVRTDRQLDLVIESLQENPGIVLFTLVDERLRRRLEDTCRELGLPSIPVLDPVITTLATYLGQESQAQPGRQHLMDARYFDRIDAMDFAMTHDDGQATDELHEADVILVGVSRTSKTPTCIYLANRGVRAANVPYVPSVPLPRELDELTRPLIVGLTNDPMRLLEVRRNRLRLLNSSADSQYVDLESIRAEVSEARRYFVRRGWPVIDVSRRSIEETAAEIISILSQRMTTAAAILGGKEP